MSLAQELDARWQRNFEASQKRMSLKERAIAHLGGRCQVCGYDRCLAAFDFHHIDAREKDFAISSSMNWERIKAELEKCILLCSNCHREVHAGWHPQYLELDEGGRDFGEPVVYYDLSFEDDEDTDVQLRPGWSEVG